MTKLILIMLVQLVYVPMLSLRTICMVKNLKILTSLFGFLEALVYIFGLAIVLSGEQSYLEMFVYAVGFAVGLLAGILIEQKLAIGFSSFEVNINHENPSLIKDLRDRGYGVTVFTGEGRNGSRLRLDILTQRKREKDLIKIVLDQEPNAFIMSYEPKMFQGGYLREIMKKRMSLRRSKKSLNNDHGVLERTVEEIKMEVNTIKEEWKN